MMATCPMCRRYYREPEDEQGEHDCPYCGFSRDEAREISHKRVRELMGLPEEEEESDD